MTNFHITLTSLFSDIADAIRRKTGSSSTIVADDFPTAIDAIPTGTPLPVLSDPASASDIISGKEAIDGQGQKLTGTLVPSTDTGANGLYKAIIQGDTLNIMEYNDDLTQIGPYELAGYGYNSADRNSNLYLEFENVESVQSYGCGETYCYLKYVKFNKNVSVNSYAFRHNTILYCVDFEKMSLVSGASTAFRDCSSLRIFVIRANTLCPLTNTNTFTNTSANLKIYVLPDLVSTYKSATNWATFSSQIYPFYIAASVSDIQTFLDDPDVISGALIICDSGTTVSEKYTVKT